MSLKTITRAIAAFFKKILQGIQSFLGSIGASIQNATEGNNVFGSGQGGPKGKNLYALIIGINEYQNVTQLGGCVNDANRMHKYLETVTAEGDFNFHPIVLTNQQATHANIIKAFKKHLTKAGENDVALFYFSGHGAQEEAEKVWLNSEDDGYLETMVCHDSRDKEKGTPDFADKEQRYLINLVAKKNPHIVIIADSCHSGDSSRSSELRKRSLNEASQIQAGTEEDKARLSNKNAIRDWDKFCFSHEITRDMVQNASALEDVMPQGKHIAFAACRDRELAYETSGAGIFTSTLLDVLKRSKGDITYHDLYARLRNTVFGRTESQMPQIYASSGEATDMKQRFLGGASNQKPHFYNVSRNPNQPLGWMIDIGAIHGMPAAGANDKIVINILDPEDPTKVLTTAIPKVVMPGYTQLRLADSIKKRDYTATIDGLFLNPINFYVAGVQEGIDALKTYTEKESSTIKRSNINFVDIVAIADYMIVAKEKLVNEKTVISYYIGITAEESLAVNETTYPIQRGDITDNIPSWKWCTQSCIGTDEQSLETLVKYMQHISSWEFLKRLKKPVEYSPIDDFIDVTFYQGKYEGTNLVEKKKLEPNEDNIIHLDFPYTAKNGKPLNHLLIDVKNKDFDHTVYAAMPALFNEFDIYTDVLRGGSIEFPPEHKESANKGKSLPYTMPNYIRDFNYEYVPIFFKVIISASDFEVTSFAQKGLPQPVKEEIMRKEGFANFNEEVGAVTVTDWTVKTYEVRFKNPFYVKPPEL